VRINEIVSRARAYAQADDAPPAEALLSVLIDWFTGDQPAAEALAGVAPDAVQRAWDKLTRDLDVPAWLLASRALADGVDLLAANLIEAGRPDFAAALRALHEPHFEGAARSADASRESLHPSDEGVATPPDDRLWAPRPGRLATGLPQ